MELQAGVGGYSRRKARARGWTDERGVVVVLFAVLLGLVLLVGSMVVAIGSWYVHAKHLQTKVDAAAFAGGGAWGFPCGPDIDADIETQARKYFGVHTMADTNTYTGTTYNPQVGSVQEDKIMLALNQAQWWDDSWAAGDWTTPSGPVCQTKTLDVKATEDDSPLLWGVLPFFPDIKRKARVQIEEVDGLTGLLPIAVRIPQPLSAAAVFYNEDTGMILDVKRFREMCTPFETDCIVGTPPGLGQWTTAPDPTDPDPAASWARFDVAGATGLVVATSFRPACGTGTPPAGPPCLNSSGWANQPVDTFCRQGNGLVRCYDASGTGTTQTVNSGVHFIRGYTPGDAGDGRPEVRGAWLENVSCPATGYFNSHPSSCRVKLTVQVDIGSRLENPPPDPPDETVETRTGDHIEVRYCLARTGQTDADVCNAQFGVNQDLNCASGGPGLVTCSSTAATDPLITANSIENALAIQVRLRRTSVPGFPLCDNDPTSEYHNNCRFFYTGAGYLGPSVPPTGAQILAAPIQRSFMGDIDRTTPLKWIRLTVDQDCNLGTLGDVVIGHDLATGADAASQPADDCAMYVVDLGTSGGMARDQDEPPIAFNLGDNSSQRAYVDCDPNIANLKSEVVTGCQWPPYSANKFDTSPLCPGSAGFFSVPKPAPFDNPAWPPFRCVLTQTGNSSQVEQGFNERIFDRPTNPQCPSDVAGQYVKGRNYWHRMNNLYDAETFAWDGTGPPGPNGQRKGNTIRSDDPRLFTLFFTSYDSFTDTGNEVYPVVGFGNFYITGWGRTQNGGWQGGSPDDPCTTGNDGDPYNGTGNEPPPDLDMSRNTTWAWGHFVKDVTPPPFSTGGSGILCNPESSFQPCVPVLVE
jgi:hypothetical protein